MSKHQQVLNHLKKYGSITPKEAWLKYGLYRLSSVINRLRAKGYDIETVKEGKEGYAKYRLREICKS